jgi:hypothetical protein
LNTWVIGHNEDWSADAQERIVVLKKTIGIIGIIYFITFIYTKKNKEIRKRKLYCK